MGTTTDKLNKLIQTKVAIKAALVEKGQNPSDVFSTYANNIKAISTGVDNPLIANSDTEMNTYLNDTKYLNMYVKFTGQSETYVTGETYKIVEEDADPTQYEPVGSTLSVKDFLTVRNGQYLFYDCGTLTDDQLNSIIKYDDTENVTKMAHMFSYCTKLTTIPLLNTNNVTDMNSMFRDCYKLTKIDINELATSYRNDSFAESCYSLKTLVIRTMNTIPSLSSSAFTNCYHFYGTVDATYNPDGLKNGRIYVPDDKVESLKAATNWSVFADIIVPLSTYVEEV